MAEAQVGHLVNQVELLRLAFDKAFESNSVFFTSDIPLEHEVLVPWVNKDGSKKLDFVMWPNMDKSLSRLKNLA